MAEPDPTDSVNPRARRNPEAMNPDPLTGYVWLEWPGKVLHAEERHLEFTGKPPEGS